MGNGKSSLIKALTGKSTLQHSKEKDSGRTVVLGYSNLVVWGCMESTECYWSTSDAKEEAPRCGTHCRERRVMKHVSLVDCPGHHALMATTVSGAAVMDAAILCIEKVDSQTTRHLILGEACNIRNWIVCHTKADRIPAQLDICAARAACRRAQMTLLGIGMFRRRASCTPWMPRELFQFMARQLSARPIEATLTQWGGLAVEGYAAIQELLAGTSAEKAPIIPVSSVQELNLQPLLHAIVNLPRPQRSTSQLLMSVVRSFDVNRPGGEVEALKGGVVGGTLLSGRLKVGDCVSLYPGLQGGGSLRARVVSLQSEQTSLTSAEPGGLIACGLTLDPALAKNNGLVGQMIALDGGAVPPALATGKLRMRFKLLKGFKLAAGSEVRLSRLSATVVSKVLEIDAKRIATVELYSMLPLENAHVSVFMSLNSKGFDLIGVGTFLDVPQAVAAFDPSSSKKKKKKTTKEAMAKNDDPAVLVPFDAAVVPSYAVLIARILATRQDLVTKDKVIMLPTPVVFRTAKKLIWDNFAKTCAKMGRDTSHVIAFLEKETFLKGSVDGENRLVLKGTLGPFRTEKLQSALVSYCNTFVRCDKCGSHSTIMERKKNNRFAIHCKSCYSFKNVNME